MLFVVISSHDGISSVKRFAGGGEGKQKIRITTTEKKNKIKTNQNSTFQNKMSRCKIKHKKKNCRGWENV